MIVVPPRGVGAKPCRRRAVVGAHGGARPSPLAVLFFAAVSAHRFGVNAARRSEDATRIPEDAVANQTYRHTPQAEPAFEHRAARGADSGKYTPDGMLDVAAGVGQIHWATMPGKCLDVIRDDLGNATLIGLWDCMEGRPNQLFMVPAANSARMIRSAGAPGKCLDVFGGLLLGLWKCTDDSSNQEFVVPSNGTSGQIRWARNPTMCLDVLGGNSTNGNKIILWVCEDGNANQMFRYAPKAETPPEHRAARDVVMDSGIDAPSPLLDVAAGAGQINWATMPEKCLDVFQDSLGHATLIGLWDCMKGRSKQLFMVPAANRSGVIRSAAAPGKCLDVFGGLFVGLWDCIDGSSNQSFVVPSEGTSGQIRWARNPAMCFSLLGWRFWNGNNIVLWSCMDGNASQMFRYIPQAETALEQTAARDVVMDSGNHTQNPLLDVAAGAGQIHWATMPEKCLDVIRDDQGNATLIGLWDCMEGRPKQLFMVPAANRSGMIRLAGAPGKCLDVFGGLFVGLWKCTDDSFNQEFVVPPEGTSGQIRWAKDPTRCLDVLDGNSTNGNNILLWSCMEGNANQMFRYTPQTDAELQLRAAPDDVMDSGIHTQNPLLDVAAGVGQIQWATMPEKCLDVIGDNLRNATLIGLWDCTEGRPNQLFIFPAANSSGMIRSAGAPRKCIDVFGGLFVGLWDCMDNSSNQEFVFPPQGTSGQIRWARDPTKCLDVLGGNSTNGNNIVLWRCMEGNANQMFRYNPQVEAALEHRAARDVVMDSMLYTPNPLLDVAAGAGQIQWATMPEKCLDIIQNHLWFDLIGLWDCMEGRSNQLFMVPAANSPGMIRSAGAPGKCLHVFPDFFRGLLVGLRDCMDKCPRQKFIFASQGTSGQIRWAISPTLCLDVMHGNSTNGNNIVLWRCMDGNANQMFSYIPQAEAALEHGAARDDVMDSGIHSQTPLLDVAAGAGQIQWATMPEKCLDVIGDNLRNATLIGLWDCMEGRSNQLFIFPAANSSGMIRSAGAPDKCLDVFGGLFVGLWDCMANNSNQEFMVPSEGTSGQIRWARDPTRCLDVVDGNSTNGNNIVLWRCMDGNANQMFRFSSLA